MKAILVATPRHAALMSFPLNRHFDRARDAGTDSGILKHNECTMTNRNGTIIDTTNNAAVETVSWKYGYVGATMEKAAIESFSAVLEVCEEMITNGFVEVELHFPRVPAKAKTALYHVQYICWVGKTRKKHIDGAPDSNTIHSPM